MPDKQYPFIDIAVHPGVRDRFAAGEAIILFSLDMNDVLWSNGAGARLFGNGLIYDFLDHGPDRNDVSFRQLEAAARQLSNKGDKRGFMIRIASGFQRIAVRSEVERIEIAPGDDVIMFSTPVAASALGRAAAARQMLEGFDDPDTHMAVIDGQGQILAASHDFGRIGISPELAFSLVEAVGRSRDGLIKRPIQTGMGYLPAAIGKLSRDPDLNLLFCVETVLGRMDPPETGAATAPAESAPSRDEFAGGPLQPATPAFSVASTANAEDFEDDLFIDETIAEAGPVSDAGEQVFSDLEAGGDLTPAVVEPPRADIEPVPDLDDKPAPQAVIDETGQTDAATIDAAGEEIPVFSFNAAGRPVRFVWKIDADGAFSEISGEFAATVGPNAGNISGIAFSDLAALLHLDPDGKIGELLKRRDTWSGRTIRWPVEGTNLVVPIDLAALPTYSRNREFDGFRGFGIIRVSDAEIDPLAMGLTFGEPADEVALPAEAEAGEEIELTVDERFRDLDHRDSTTGAPTEAVEPIAPDFTDEFRGETPALRIEAGHGRRFSEKIIQLEERRARAREGLSPVEQAAFREIARQLEPFGKRPNEELLKDLEGNHADEAAEIAPETAVETGIDTDIPDDRVGEAEGWVDAEAAADVSGDVLEPAPAPDEATGIVAATVEAAREQVDAMMPSRTRSEEALNAAIIDQLPVALLVHAGDRLIHANAEFFRLTGYADLDALRQAGGIDALITRMESDDSDAQGAVFMVCRNESVIPVHARLQSVRWQDQTALMLAIAPIALPAPTADKPDETELEADYSQLKVEADELRAILETATDGVVLVSGDGEIRSMNRSASALFNYDNAETRGRPFAMLFAHESQKAVMDYLGGLAGHGVASVLNDGREVIGREANGGFIPLFMTMGKLASSNGYCAVIRDITQWKRSEEELKSAKRAAETANAHKSDFLARVSHEIRTPLNAIIGFADMMASEHFGPIGHPRYVEYANDIGRSGRHVLDIVNDLLDISKIEAGEMELEFSAVGINDCISEAVSIIQPQANSQRVIIRTSLSQSVPDIVADLRSIKQIALNILANAIKFTPSGGQVVVSTAYEPSGSVVLRIRDTGIGMTRTELEQAMKPFRQVTTGRAKRGEGTGLGLPLTKAMVEANRANFSISSQPNEGTLVEITFPSQRVLAD